MTKLGEHIGKKVREYHVAVTEEPEGKYLTHFIPDPKTTRIKPAKQCALALVNWLRPLGIDKTLDLIGSDTTPEMSGHKGGTLTHVEILIGRRLFRVMCCLHINELPCKHLVTKLDGSTLSGDSWSGPVARLFGIVECLPRRREFEPIPFLEPLTVIPDDIVKGMSTDSRLAYRLVQAIAVGELSEELAAMTPGKLNHSRWLTTGMRCLLLYASDHGLSRKHTNTLRLLATWVTQVYFPMYFGIKVLHHIQYGSCHVVTLFRLWRQQDPKVQTATKAYLPAQAWWAHPEPLLVALLASPVQADREFGIKQVRHIRSISCPTHELTPEQLGSVGLREYTVPKTVNLQATSLQDLIDWTSEELSEPVFTAKLSVKQLESLKHAPLVIPKYSIHTQSCERAVQMVTNAAMTVTSQARRHAIIQSKNRTRSLLPTLTSKKYFSQLSST